jgi:oligopeptide transport system permease protein
MLSFAIKRLLGAIPTLLVIVTIAFFLMRLAPGGPFDNERVVTAAVEANLNQTYHLDEPLIMQYGHYLLQIVTGDFGPSFQYRDFTVSELIWAGFPVSLKLGGLAIILAFVFGVVLGSLAALNQNSWLDYSIMTFSMTGIVIPNFVMAPLLTLVFAIYLDWLPAGGWGGGDFRHSLLPVIALALPQIAYIARLTRGSMVEVLRANYIRTARSKGLPERLTLFRHAIKGGLIPVISYLGPTTAAIVTGSVVVEQIFGIPGIGRYFVQGALNRDYTLVMGVVIFYGGLIIAANIVVDLLYGWLDPRARLDGVKGK